MEPNIFMLNFDGCENCATMGVFAPLVGIIGSMQAAEAIKVIAGIGEPLVGRLLILDATDMKWHSVRVRRDPGCPVCAQRKGDLPSVVSRH